MLKTRTSPEDPQLAKVITNLVRKGYFLVDDVLYYERPDVPDRRRVVVPQHLRGKIINENHDAAYVGHFAVKKVTQRITQYFYWSGMRGDIYKKFSGCVICASVSGQGTHEKPALVNIPVGGSFECIGMDFIEMDKSKGGNRHAFVIQDYLTKWPEVYAVQDRKAEQSLSACKILFGDTGCCQELFMTEQSRSVARNSFTNGHNTVTHLRRSSPD